MIKLVGSPGTRTFRVLWLLEELGLDYELERAAPHSDAIKAVNPAGKLPALVVDNDVILDSVAIMTFLTERNGRFTAPAGTVERARQDSLTHFVLDEFDAVLWNAAKHKFVLPEAMRLEGVHACAEHELGRSLKTLESRLGSDDYLNGGSEPTVPDFLLVHCAGWLQSSKFTWPAGALTNYLARMRERPAFIRTLALREQAA